MIHRTQQQLREQLRRQIASTLRKPREGGCTAETSRCPDARDYRANLRDCCRGHIRDMMTHIQIVLDSLGIVWWADYGTILGAVRNPLLGLPAGIIPHDKDADLGVLACTHHTLAMARRRLEAYGHQVLIRPMARSMKVRLSRTNHTNVDLFNWFPRPDGSYYRKHYIDVDRYKGREIPPGLLFPLAPIEWEGLQIPAPHDGPAFCAFRYGPNWMTPVHANHDGVLR